MANLTIESMPESLHERIRESAEMNYRSINSEVIARLEQALGSSRVSHSELLERIRTVRRRMGRARLTDRSLREARSEGRP